GLLQCVEPSEFCRAADDAKFRRRLRLRNAVRGAIATNRSTWIKILMVKNFLVIPLVLLLSVQKPVKKPDVHPDFQFGFYPWSRGAETLMKDDLARQIVVASSLGWSSDKIAKTLKISPADVSKISDKLEDERLAGRR